MPQQDMISSPECIPSTDEKGHNVGISTRVPAAWVRQMDYLLKEKDLPYFNKGDLVRDAVFKHLRYLEELDDPTHESAYFRIQTLTKIIVEDRTCEEFKKLLKLVDKKVKEYMDEGDREEAAKYVMRIMTQVRHMPDSYWRDKYVVKLMEKYEALSMEDSEELKTVESRQASIII